VSDEPQAETHARPQSFTNMATVNGGGREVSRSRTDA